MKKVGILLVLIIYGYHKARLKKRKVSSRHMNLVSKGKQLVSMQFNTFSHFLSILRISKCVLT
jgi:hypothetical protein